MEEQLRNVIDTCGCFSLQSGELTDMVNVAHLFVFIELVFEDTSTKEELLTILPLTGHTRDEDRKWYVLARFGSFLMLSWDLLSRQNWRSWVDASDIATKLQ